MKLLNTLALSTAAGLLTAASAMAAPVLIQHEFSGNDCAGYFGQGFGACQIFVYEDDKRINISPVIAKYDYESDGVEVEINSALYPTFTGSEITMDLKAQTWSYSPDEGDPGIRYWAAKGGDNFNLFWYVDSADAATCDGNAYTLACLEQAMVVTSGSWTTPPVPGPSGNLSGLSHLTFYNTEQPHLVPEPGTTALLLAGAMGLFMSRRRKSGSAVV